MAILLAGLPFFLLAHSLASLTFLAILLAGLPLYPLACAPAIVLAGSPTGFLDCLLPTYLPTSLQQSDSWEQYHFQGRVAVHAFLKAWVLLYRAKLRLMLSLACNRHVETGVGCASTPAACACTCTRSEVGIYALSYLFMRALIFFLFPFMYPRRP